MRGLLDTPDFILGNFELGTGPLNRLGIPLHSLTQGLAVDKEESIDAVRQACGQWHDELSEASLRFCALEASDSPQNHEPCLGLRLFGLRARCHVLLAYLMSPRSAVGSRRKQTDLPTRGLEISQGRRNIQVQG